MLIPSFSTAIQAAESSLSRRVNANSQLKKDGSENRHKLIKKGEC